MPLLQYPTTGNPRRGYDFNAFYDVRMTVSAAWGETLTFRFLMSEGNVSAGTFAQVVIKVTAANIADATTFIIADQTFTVDNTITSNTATKVNFNQSDALIHAQNLQYAILSNLFFSGKVQALVAVDGSDYVITVTWLQRGEQFTGASTAPSPYTIESEIMGTNAELVEGYALIYQVWMDDNGDIKPITDFRAVVPQITASQQFDTCEVEVNDALRPYLQLVFPYGAKNTAGVETNARKSFWVLYGWREIDRSSGLCEAVFHDLKQTDPEWVVYAALQETDRFGMRPYFSGGDAPIFPEMRFMTKRPHFNVGRNSIGWLYAILDLEERLDMPSVNYKFYVDRWDGAAWVNVSNSSIGTADGVYRIPAHPKNLPTALSSSVKRYRTEIRAEVDSFENTYASQIWDINACEPVMQVWFLGDLCAFEDFSFDELVGEDEVVETEIALVPIRPFDNDNLVNYGTRLATGGRQVVNTRNYRRITGSVNALCDKESFIQYLESFLKSPIKYYRFISKTPPDTGAVSTVEIQRSVFIDPSSISFRSEGEMQKVEITFYFHKSLNVQI